MDHHPKFEFFSKSNFDSVTVFSLDPWSSSYGFWDTRCQKGPTQKIITFYLACNGSAWRRDMCIVYSVAISKQGIIVLHWFNNENDQHWSLPGGASEVFVLFWANEEVLTGMNNGSNKMGPHLQWKSAMTTIWRSSHL